MFNCKNTIGIIIKPKDMDIIKARTIFSDILLVNDYSYDCKIDDNDVLFSNEKLETSIDEFIKEFEEQWLQNNYNGYHVWPTIFIQKEDLYNYLIPYGFWEFFDVDWTLKDDPKTTFIRLRNEYEKAYLKWINHYVKEINNKEDFNVCLLSYDY